MKGTGTSLTAVVETVLSVEGMSVILGINKLDHAIWVGEGLLGMMKGFAEKNKSWFLTQGKGTNSWDEISNKLN